MNKAFIISTDKGEVKDFVGEVLRYVEEQKNWSRGQARQYIGWSDMVQGETAIVAQPGKIDSTLFKDALKFAKTETKTDYKMARPDNYIGESRGERKHGGRMLKESEENYYDVKNVHLEVFDVGDNDWDTDPQYTDMSFSGYYKDEDELIERIGESFGVKDLQKYPHERNDGEHKEIIVSLMADNIDKDDATFGLSNANLDANEGEYEVIFTITYDGGKMNEDIDEDEDLYVVPEWALPYIVNNDPSGLDDDEIEAVDNFVKNLPGGVLDTLEDEDGNIYTFFSRTNDLPGKHGELGNTCVEMRFVKI